MLTTDLAANIGGRVRREYLNGRPHLVAPVVMLVPGVLHGSSGPLRYKGREVGKNPESWNGVPVTVDHPHDERGRAITARCPDVLNDAIGVVLYAHFDGKLRGEAWLDIERAERIDRRIIDNLQAGRPIECSTGLQIDVRPKRGRFKGRRYRGVAVNLRPDHLAVLPDTVGACSIEDGCGVLAANEDRMSEDLVQWALNKARKYTMPRKPTQQDFDALDMAPPTMDWDEVQNDGAHDCHCSLCDGFASDVDALDMVPPRIDWREWASR